MNAPFLKDLSLKGKIAYSFMYILEHITAGSREFCSLLQSCWKIFKNVRKNLTILELEAVKY